MRIVFMGTPEIAATVLKKLAHAFPGQIVGVLSQPDRPKGRDLAILPTPVKVVAQALSIPIAQPEKARSPESLGQLRIWEPDVIIVVAYGQILPQTLLDLPPRGCLNLHTSLLPRWRGAAPIQWAIAAGDTITGATLMRMDAGLDTGPIVAARPTPIHSSDTGQSLYDRLAEIGSDLLIEVLPSYIEGKIQLTPQPDTGATYARKISKEDGRVDWNLPVHEIWCRLRAFTPWPGGYTHLRLGEKHRLLKIHQATPSHENGPPGQVLVADSTGILVGCGVGSLRITEIQPEGGRRMAAGQFVSGNPNLLGNVLGS